MTHTFIALLTIGALHVMAGAPTAAKLATSATVVFTLTAVQTAVFQFAFALDLNTKQVACYHSLKAHHNLLLPKRIDKDT